MTVAVQAGIWHGGFIPLQICSLHRFLACSACLHSLARRRSWTPTSCVATSEVEEHTQRLARERTRAERVCKRSKDKPGEEGTTICTVSVSIVSDGFVMHCDLLCICVRVLIMPSMRLPPAVSDTFVHHWNVWLDLFQVLTASNFKLTSTGFASCHSCPCSKT